MSKDKDLSFLEDEINNRVEKTRLVIPDKKGNKKPKNWAYFLLGAVIIISILAGLINTLVRLF